MTGRMFRACPSVLGIFDNSDEFLEVEAAVHKILEEPGRRVSTDKTIWILQNA